LIYLSFVKFSKIFGVLMDYDNKCLEDSYDAIIIGAGIGGLACGCYLAKEGMKVLIVEQHNKPGGCCTSFNRKGITFDAAVHILASCSEGGLLGEVLDELDLRDEIKFIRMNPTDVILTIEHEISIKTDWGENIDIFCNIFPKEARSIKNFFKYIDSVDRKKIHNYLNLSNKRFGEMLQTYFKDKHLISLLSVLLFYTGVPAYEASVLISVFGYKQLLDSGYYPIGGMQRFSDAFAKKFIEYGGTLLLSNKICKIEIKDREVTGVRLQGNEYIRSRNVISNCDARQTYFELINKQHSSIKFINEINKLLTTSSFFTICLGLNKPLSRNNTTDCLVWYFPKRDINTVFSEVFYNKEPYFKDGVMCILNPKSGEVLTDNICETLYLCSTASYMTSRYWKENRERIADELIKRAEDIFPGLSSSIVVKSICSPHDIEKFTLNYKGAMNGWACIPKQVSSPKIRMITKIKKLYMIGHWVSQSFGGGVSTVAYMGLKAAKLIKHRECLK
jgi:prolycopene isomerase